MPDVAGRSFPTKQKPSIERADVIAYLAELEERGWDVYKDDVGRFSITMGLMEEMTGGPPRN